MKTETTDASDSPIAWFYTLEDARQRNDFERAARAKRELERLGIVVKYIKQRREQAKCTA